MLSFQKGDILFAASRGLTKGYHPIVFIEELNDEDFIGAMLTHGVGYSDNAVMLPTHFNNPTDGLMFTYEGTHIVKTKLLKAWEWGPFKKVGSLSPAGIEFMEEHLRGKAPVDWRTYLRKKVA